jgi:hypothetical protein
MVAIDLQERSGGCCMVANLGLGRAKEHLAGQREKQKAWEGNSPFSHFGKGCSCTPGWIGQLWALGSLWAFRRFWESPGFFSEHFRAFLYLHRNTEVSFLKQES